MLHWKPFDEMLSCDYSISTVSLIVVECLTKYLPEYSAVPPDSHFCGLSPCLNIRLCRLIFIFVVYPFERSPCHSFADWARQLKEDGVEHVGSHLFALLEQLRGKDRK